MKKSITFLFVLSVSFLFAAEGDILLFDEFRNPTESAKNWFNFLSPNGKPYIDKEKVVIADGMATLKNGTRLFSIVKNIRNCETEFEFRMSEDEVSDGKHRGFIGFELRPLLIKTPQSTPEELEAERSFRVMAQIGRPMMLNDINTPGKKPRRTANSHGMNQSKMPVMEAGRWYKMKLVCKNQDVEIWLDGVEIGTVKHKNEKDDFNPEGRIALWVHAGTGAFRNIIVTDTGDGAANEKQ